MANEKPISKDYLLTQLKNYETEIINKKYIEKEDGKTLISTEDISQIAQNKTDIETLNGIGEGSVDKKIADKLSEQTYLTKEIATADEVAAYITDPTTAKFNVIYLVKDESATGADVYFEYQRIGNEETSTFEMTGDTSTNLADYAKSAEIPTTVAELTDSADYAKTSDVNDSISALQTDKANASDLTAHTDDADIHVTVENKTLWNTVDGKVDKTNILTNLDSSTTDEQVYSAKAINTELDKVVKKTDIATTIDLSSTDEQVASAKAVYDGLENINDFSVQVVKENLDLNDITETGIYYFSQAYTPVNIPMGVNGWLLVMKGSSSDIVKQVWYRLGTTNSNSYNTFERYKGNNTWSEWTKFLTEKEYYNALDYGNPIIPQDDDLNDYLTPGVYTCMSSTIANTLLNCPHIDSNFKLIVNKNRGNDDTLFYGYQMIVGTKGGSPVTDVCVYYRGISVYNNVCVFSKWKIMSGSTVADVPITYINTFEDETYVKPASTNVCSYYVSNGNCIISIETTCLSTSTGFTQIISGLPKPKSTLYANAIDRMMSANSGARGLFQLTCNGTLNIACNYGDTSVETIRYLYVSFSYPVAES